MKKIIKRKKNKAIGCCERKLILLEKIANGLKFQDIEIAEEMEVKIRTIENDMALIKFYGPKILTTDKEIIRDKDEDGYILRVPHEFK